MKNANSTKVYGNFLDILLKCAVHSSGKIYGHPFIWIYPFNSYYKTVIKDILWAIET